MQVYGDTLDQFPIRHALEVSPDGLAAIVLQKCNDRVVQEIGDYVPARFGDLDAIEPTMVLKIPPGKSLF